MLELTIKPVVASRAQPVGRQAGIALLRPQIKLDRQLKVMGSFAVAQQHVQLAQRVSAHPNWQIGSDQLHTRCVLYCKLP